MLRYLMRMVIALLAGWILWCWSPLEPCRPATADAAEPASVDELVSLIEKAKSEFHPIASQRVPDAEADLRRAIDQLDDFLQTGSAANEAQWKEYLEWDEMLAQLDNPAGPDVRQLNKIMTLYYANFGSLEHPRFTATRDALFEYGFAQSMANNPQLEASYAAQLDKLAEQLPQYEQQPTTRLSQEIGNRVGWLEMADQAEELVTAIRARYWHPNMYAVVSERMVNTAANRDVVESEAVKDCILGTSLVGTAMMKGRTSIQLIDNPSRLQLQLKLNGLIRSDSVGTNRGVRICTEGATTVCGCVTLHIDDTGVSAGPAHVECSTDSTITGLCANSRLIEHIARKRARRSKAEGEAIASDKAARRVENRLEQRVAKTLDESRRDFLERFRWPLVRRNEFPQELKFQTTSGYLKAAWRQANTTQLAAAGMPPAIETHNDVAVQVHESFVSNFSRAMIGGVKLTDERLVELLEENGAEVPAAVQLSDEKAPWAITFSSREPVSAQFSDGTLRFAIRGRLFELGETRVDKELEMSALYDLEKTAAGALLTRQGDVSVEYVNAKGRLTADDIIVRTVMREKFEALFAERIERSGITLPEKWGDGGQLRLVDMISQGGWLNLAWLQQ